MQTTSAILILGDHELHAADLDEAASFEEVFVLARAVPAAGSRYVVDDDVAYARAARRLRDAAAGLRSRGTRVSGVVGDGDVSTARRDAVALFPRATVLLEAA